MAMASASIPLCFYSIKTASTDVCSNIFIATCPLNTVSTEKPRHVNVSPSYRFVCYRARFTGELLVLAAYSPAKIAEDGGASRV
jgi:hypothetical protein